MNKIINKFLWSSGFYFVATLTKKEYSIKTLIFKTGKWFSLGCYAMIKEALGKSVLENFLYGKTK